jgi:CRISPR-associated protein Cas6/Cse3/CasE subtype I-E
MNDTPTCWLTRALITPRTLLARGIRDAYAWHQLVWQAFPGRDGEARDFLTRLDDKPGGTQLLIVSPREPERPQWLGQGDVWETKPIPQAYFQLRCYRFQLRANPTHKPVKDSQGVYIADAKKRKRRALTGQAELAAWLRRKGETGGFRLVESVALETWRDVQRFEKGDAQGPGRKGVHASVDFSGVIEITDAPLFLTRTFAKGIGSAKAFGFGLVVLAPAR